MSFKTALLRGSALASVAIASVVGVASTYAATASGTTINFSGDAAAIGTPALSSFVNTWTSFLTEYAGLLIAFAAVGTIFVFLRSKFAK